MGMGEGVEGLEKRSGAIRMKGVWGHLDEEGDAGCWNCYVRCVGVGTLLLLLSASVFLGRSGGRKQGLRY